MDFADRIAVVTGGGSGMGRELVIQLAADGCHVATCDVRTDAIGDTVERALKEAPPGTRVTGHDCDVSDEAGVGRFRDEVVAQHETDHVNLLFNNAGIGGGGSFVAGERADWDRTFAICWGGVYNCSRAFVPLVVASDAGYIVNTSSVNGFWASLGPGVPHTAYSTAKFAVKGFSEALITDLRVNAPHVKVAVVMPGHIGTDIITNSRIILGGPDPEAMSPEQLAIMRAQLEQQGMPIAGVTDDQLRMGAKMMAEGFRTSAPLDSAQAATIILDGVRNDDWRILVGDDARRLDESVRADPLSVYEPDGLALRSITG